MRAAWVYFILFTTLANAQIIYNDIADIDLGNGEPHDVRFVSSLLDINADGTGDIEVGYGGSPSYGLFLRFFTGGQNQAYILPLPNLDTLGVAVPLGASIGPDAVYSGYGWSAPQVDALGNRYGSHYGSPAGVTFGYRLDPSGTSYLPFRLPTVEGWHYGWIRLVQPELSTSLVIDAWAYEGTPDTAIIAGAIPESGALALLVVGGLAALGWAARRRPRRKGGAISAGQEQMALSVAAPSNPEKVFFRLVELED